MSWSYVCGSIYGTRAVGGGERGSRHHFLQGVSKNTRTKFLLTEYKSFVKFFSDEHPGGRVSVKIVIACYILVGDRDSYFGLMTVEFAL